MSHKFTPRGTSTPRLLEGQIHSGSPKNGAILPSSFELLILAFNSNKLIHMSFYSCHIITPFMPPHHQSILA